MGEKRVTMQVDLPPDLQGSLRDFCRRTGRIQKEVVAQVLRWFLLQQGVVRRVVLNDVDAGMEAEYADALERMAAEVRASQVIDVDDPEADEDEAGGDAEPNGSHQRPASNKAKGRAGRHTEPSPGRARGSGHGVGKPH